MSTGRRISITSWSALGLPARAVWQHLVRPNSQSTKKGIPAVRTLLAAAAPYLVVVLLLLSLGTLWFAALIHGAPFEDSGGVQSWQGTVEMVLAYLNLGWVSLLILGFWRGWLPMVLLGLLGFVVNYCAWIFMAIETPL